MRIQSESREQFLELVANETFDGAIPSVCLEVSVTDGSFAGANHEVWIVADSLLAFVSQVRSIEETRRGTAQLESMSPQELVLVIEPVDRLGHFRLRYTVGRTSVTANGNAAQYLTGSFDLDSEFLGSLLRDLEAWAAPLAL